MLEFKKGEKPAEVSTLSTYLSPKNNVLAPNNIRFPRDFIPRVLYPPMPNISAALLL